MPGARPRVVDEIASCARLLARDAYSWGCYCLTVRFYRPKGALAQRTDF